MKTKTAVLAIVVGLIFSFNSAIYADWVSLELDGENISEIIAVDGFLSSGHPFLDVLATNQEGELFVKHESDWVLTPITGVSCLEPERNDDNQDAWILSSSGVYIVYSSAIGNAYAESNHSTTCGANVADDGKFLYSIIGNQIIRSKDGQDEEILPDTGLPSATKNCIFINDSVLYLGTSEGCYSYNLAVSAPTNVSTSLVGSTINISWSASDGATGYKVLALSSINEWTEYDVGNVTSYSISSVEVIAVKVVAYDSDGYETAIADCEIKDVVDPSDTTPPSWTIDLVADQIYGNPNAVVLKFTAPFDDRRVESYKVQCNLSPFGLYYSTNPYLYYIWNFPELCNLYWGFGIESVEQSIVPALPGSEESITISGLTQGVTYHAAMSASDARGNESPISNNVNFVPIVISAPVYSGERKLVWNEGAEFDLAGYIIYYGTESGVYTNSVQILGKETISYYLSDLGLIKGYDYYFIIRACTESGLESTASNEVIFIP